MARKKTRNKPKPPKPRFGIGEWYGKSFIRLTQEERSQFAALAIGHKPREKETCPPCPFRTLQDGKFAPCNKKGGVCSLRLYQPIPNETAPRTKIKELPAMVASGEAGKLVTVCPNRFNQDGMIFNWVGEVILETREVPHVIDEVRFLQRIKTVEAERITEIVNVPSSTEMDTIAQDPDLLLGPAENEGEPEEDENIREDVGNIDNVLVHPRLTPFLWCALEIQAVYFSGSKMGELFAHIQAWGKAELPSPDRQRRPDYRSSGPKRLMPQLQIKVPTLRRWGRKMAVVVDEQFFASLGEIEEIPNPKDISNCDIVWFIVGYDEGVDSIKLSPRYYRLTTLERAVEGLTNGIPVSLSRFEQRIRNKLRETGIASE